MEWGPYHRFCRGIEFFLLLAWECKKRSRDRLKRVSCYPFPSPSSLLLVLCLLGMCKEKERHQRRSPLSSCSLLQNSIKFRNAGIARVVDRLTFAILHNAERERKRFMKRRVLISIMKPHLAFPIHPSTLRSSPRAGREVFTFNYRRIHHPFDPPLFDVRVRPPLSANLHLNQGLLWRRRRRRKRRRREANNQPTN